jgi:hypothetical protein
MIQTFLKAVILAALTGILWALRITPAPPSEVKVKSERRPLTVRADLIRIVNSDAFVGIWAIVTILSTGIFLWSVLFAAMSLWLRGDLTAVLVSNSTLKGLTVFVVLNGITFLKVNGYLPPAVTWKYIILFIPRVIGLILCHFWFFVFLGLTVAGLAACFFVDPWFLLSAVFFAWLTASEINS